MDWFAVSNQMTPNYDGKTREPWRVTMTNRVAQLSVSLLTFAVFAAWAVPANAQFGLRGGLSANPDQLYVGVHTETGPVFERFLFRPNLEVGFGNDVTVVALNGEFLYPFQLENGTRLHVGGRRRRFRHRLESDQRLDPCRHLSRRQNGHREQHRRSENEGEQSGRDPGHAIYDSAIMF